MTVENPDWPQLLSKTVDDLSRVARTEIQLLEATLKRLIEAQTDKITGMLVLVVALTYGSLFLLGGVAARISRRFSPTTSFGAAGTLAPIQSTSSCQINAGETTTAFLPCGIEHEACAVPPASVFAESVHCVLPFGFRNVRLTDAPLTFAPF